MRGENLRAMRLSMGLTVSFCAQRIGESIKAQQWQAYESGARKVPVEIENEINAIEQELFVTANLIELESKAKRGQKEYLSITLNNDPLYNAAALQARRQLKKKGWHVEIYRAD